MAHQACSDQVSMERLPLEAVEAIVVPSKAKDVLVGGERRSRPSSPTTTTTTHQQKSDENKSCSGSFSKGVVGKQSDTIASYSSCSSFSKEATRSTTTCCEASSAEENGRERLKRHRIEMAGRVWIPDIWGQEDFLKDWIDCSAFDACLVPSGLMSARAALVEEGRRASSGGLRIENRC